MQKMTRLLCMCLLLSFLLSLLPAVPVMAGEAEAIPSESKLAEEKPATKAVSVGSISVPAYSGGTSSGWMTYDCGQHFGLGDTGTQSKMQIVTGTTATQFLNYGTLLKDKGYTVLYEKKIAAQSEYNRHYKFLSPDGTYVIYTYFVDAYKEVRIIVDTNKDSFRRFSYTAGSGSARTELYMVPFSASEDGYGYSSKYGSQNRNNAGAMYVIKFSDNSLFVVDGGSYMQMSDRDCERVYALLRRITGIPEGQKIVINTWFTSHYHDDHIAGFPRFLSKYYTRFDLLNVMYNYDVVGSSGDNMEIVGKLYPDAKYYKQHTGEYFTICGVRFDVLYTVEDLYTPNSSNQLVLRDVGCMRKSDEENNCSSVLRVTMGGKEILLTGDIYDADRILIAMYPQADLHADVLQIPHHAFDGHITLVKTIAPAISFLNQVESATNNRKDLYTNNHNWMPYAGTIYYGNSNLVGYCAEEGVFLHEPFTEDVDWLGWGNVTRDMDEANYFESDTVTDPEAYYQYTRVTSAPSTVNGTFMIVDHKMGYPLSYNTATGTVTNGSKAFYTNDTYYFGASQRRNVNWNMTFSAAKDLTLAIADGGKAYYVSGSVKKGSGDYWGTNSKYPNMALGREDTYTAAGMYSSWASFTQQLESTTNAVRMDMLQDNTFLLYARYNTNGSTYYPLYRDAYMAATADQGWGAPSLTKDAANAKVDYLKLRLYSYNATPDTLLLSWTGHKDYYADPGISKSQALSLLTADLRVRYSFRNSGHSGEIFYDGWQSNAPGTYWLEFPTNFSGSVAGSYPITVMFMNHGGTALNLGSFTLHIRDRSNDPATKSLFFDFTDNTASRKKYEFEPQYKGTNFDSVSRWDLIEYNSATATNDVAPGSMDTAAGTLTLHTKAADTVRKNLSIRAYAGGYNPLAYSPANAEIVQIRFKAENLKASIGETANFRLCYYKDNGTELYYDTIHTLGADYVADGEYKVITVPLSQTFRSCTSITGIRPAFSFVIPADLSKAGSITIDYLYIGPANGAPASYQATFALADGTILSQQTVLAGEAATYTGVTPTMAPDESNHYTFAGWDKALTNITADTTFIAQFASEPHSFTYSISALLHLITCKNCDYSVEAPHSYTDGSCICGEKEIKEPIEAPSLKLGHSLNLASDISVNFAIHKTYLEGFDLSAVYVESILETYEGNAKTGTTTFRLDPVAKGDFYYFTLTGITAVQMNDRILSTFYGVKEGQPYCSPVDDYSVADYAYSQLGKSTTTLSLKTLCADLLRYGTNAQIFKAYRTDALADSKMTEEYRSYLSDTEALSFGNTNVTENDLENATFEWAGKVLNLESKVTLRFVFRSAGYTGDLTGLTARMTYEDINGETKTVLLKKPELYNESLGLYVFTTDALLAAELRTVVSVQIFEGNTPVSCTLRYSADTYANGKTGTLLELCKALFAYSDSAKAYFTS